MVKEWVNAEQHMIGKIYIKKKKNTSLHLYAQTTYRRVYEKLFLLDFILLAYITHLEIKFMIKKAPGGGRKEQGIRLYLGS